MLFEPFPGPGFDASLGFHLSRLLDLLHLCLLRRDESRARRIWAFLARVHYAPLLDSGMVVPPAKNRDTAYRRAVFRLHLPRRPPSERVEVLRAHICALVRAGRPVDARDELDLYLPILPYSEHAQLHLYAAFLSLYLGSPSGKSAASREDALSDSESDQEAESVTPGSRPTVLRSISETQRRAAVGHLSQALSLCPDDPLVESFLALVGDRC